MPTAKRPITTIRNQVYQIIKQDICNGDYTPGQWLQENELAAKLNVSRSPVREALRQLTADGIVFEIPNKGVFVREFTVRDIEEVCDLRMMMESYAIQHSQPNLTGARKEELLEYLSNMEAAHKKQRLKQYIEQDAMLHNLFIELSGNSLLEECYRKVYIMIQQFRVYSLLNTQRFDESLEEHRIIIHSILIGDITLADSENHNHLKLAKEKILEYMEQKGNLSKSK